MKKLNIAVLFGGASFEHEVSLSSAYNIIKNLEQDENIEVFSIGINKKGEWFYYFGDVEKIKTGEWEKQEKENVKVLVGFEENKRGIFKLEKDSKVSYLHIDCFFPVLHGQNGEDGRMQGFFQMQSVFYVGCGIKSSVLCMNKVLTHTILDAAGINGTRWVSLRKDEIDNLKETALKVAKELSFPIFTKPASCGSSIGIKKCKNLEELKDGIVFALKYEDEIICEAFVDGKEVECAVLGGKNPKASVVGEIKPYGEFYDFDSKYKEDSKIIIPAQLSEEISNEVRKTAVKAFKIMRCYGLSRVDFFVTKKGEVFLNEINTMPGFTDISMYIKLWKQSGLSTKELLKELIDLAFKREEM